MYKFEKLGKFSSHKIIFNSRLSKFGYVVFLSDDNLQNYPSFFGGHLRNWVKVIAEQMIALKVRLDSSYNSVSVYLLSYN